MMYLKLKERIIDWLIEHEGTWQLVTVCKEEFRQYIYDENGAFIIGGENVSNFINDAYKLLYSNKY